MTLSQSNKYQIKIIVNNYFGYAISSYKRINIIFTLIIIFIFFYSFYLPYLSLSIVSSCEGMPLIYCKSRGLTRAFSEIVRFNFAEALHYNSYSIRLFSFFLIQLFLRIGINPMLSSNNYKKTVYLDIIFSALFFLFSFYNLVIQP